MYSRISRLVRGENQTRVRSKPSRVSSFVPFTTVTTGELSEHSYGVCLVNRLSENFVVDGDHGIGRKNRGLGDTRCHFHSLFPSYPHDECLGIFVAGRNFVDGRWHNGKWIAEDCE